MRRAWAWAFSPSCCGIGWPETVPLKPSNQPHAEPISVPFRSNFQGGNRQPPHFLLLLLHVAPWLPTWSWGSDEVSQEVGERVQGGDEASAAARGYEVDAACSWTALTSTHPPTRSSPQREFAFQIRPCACGLRASVKTTQLPVTRAYTTEHIQQSNIICL